MGNYSTLSFKKGDFVSLDGINYEITNPFDLETCVGINLESGEYTRLPIEKLSLPIDHSAKTKNSNEPVDLALIPKDKWDEANQRMEIIRPLIDLPKRKKKDVIRVAEKHNIHYSTIYRWIESYENERRVTALLSNQRGPKKGRRRIKEAVEFIINETIEEFYLTEQKPSPQKTIDEVKKRCKRAQLKPPHVNTIRNRIIEVDNYKRIKNRKSKKEARDRYTPIKGKFPNADWPLAFVEIDHTVLDIILVDDIHREPIGRPSITIGIDNFSRMITGFHVSLDPPSALTVGLCIAHSVLPKDEWLAKHGIESEWPVWGLMNTIHVDNAKEFRGLVLQRGCQQYNIDIEWRPVGRPEFGGHVERVLGTIASEIHHLPGTTFSNITERGEYPSTKKAVFTLTELEKWLATYITEVYHKKVHSMISTTPLKQYEKGIFGDEKNPGSGLPERIVDTERFRLDFMPFDMRTVQKYGIVWDGIEYYRDVLSPWVHSEDVRNKTKKKFLVRRDPRDISKIYFFDPELEEYFTIPYRDTSHPVISVWELRELKRKLVEEGLKEVDEDAIFHAYDKMKKIEESATKTTQKTRRKAQRKKSHSEQKVFEGIDEHFESKADVSFTDKEFESEEIGIFEDIEE